jgi:Leucine-rich repeat (LRR) protein
VEALKGNQVITTLSIAENNLSVNSSYDNDMSGVVALADAIPGMGALTTLDISNNDIGQLVLPEGWSIDYLYTLSYKYKHTDGRKQATAPEGSRIRAEGIVALASAIPDMGALSVLSLKSCLFAGGGKALAAGLKGNQGITELDISENYLGLMHLSSLDADASGIAAIADAILDMRALTILNMSKNNMKGAESGKALGDALAKNTVLKELDLSGQPKTSQLLACPNMDVAFVKAFAPGLSDNGALLKLIFGGDTYQAKNTAGGDFVDVNPEPATLEVGMTSADFSNKHIGAGGAMIVAAWISHKDKGTMLVLSLKENGLGTTEAGKVLGEMLKANSVLKELDLSSNYVRPDYGGDAPGFAQELAVGIKDNAALSCPTGNNHFQAKKRFLKTTSTCKHCGHHEDKHIKVGLTCMYAFVKKLPI